MNELRLNGLFTSINAKLEGYEQFMTLVSPQLAPKFNMIECLYPDENRLSGIISMLLDPKGEHGQGDKFLKQFFNIIEFTREISCNKSRREVEALTVNIQNSRRRIDVLLCFEGLCSNDGFNLAIENKPWTYDQCGQIEAYLSELERRNYPYLLLYLTPQGTPPTPTSIPEGEADSFRKLGKLKEISYRSHVLEWIERCIECCQSPRFRYFLEDFREYIKIQFCGGLPVMEKQLVIDQAVKKENIVAAHAIGTSWPEIAKELISTLARLVKQRIESTHGGLEMTINFEYSDANSGFRFHEKNSWSNYSISFHFENTCTNGFFVGIKKELENQNASEDDKRIAAAFDTNYEGKEYPNQYWAWWKNFEQPYNNWSSSAEPWAGIHENGQTVEMVTSMLGKVIDTMKIVQAT